MRSLSSRDHVGRGEIVVFAAPRGSDPAVDDLAKRVIGLPNEEVSAKAGHMYVGGRELAESYLAQGTFTSSFAPVAIPSGHYWVMGDNRRNSRDSRVFGPIRRGDIIGVVDLR